MPAAQHTTHSQEVAQSPPISTFVPTPSVIVVLPTLSNSFEDLPHTHCHTPPCPLLDVVTQLLRCMHAAAHSSNAHPRPLPSLAPTPQTTRFRFPALLSSSCTLPARHMSPITPPGHARPRQTILNRACAAGARPWRRARATPAPSPAYYILNFVDWRATLPSFLGVSSASAQRQWNRLHEPARFPAPAWAHRRTMSRSPPFPSHPYLFLCTRHCYPCGRTRSTVQLKAAGGMRCGERSDACAEAAGPRSRGCCVLSWCRHLNAVKAVLYESYELWPGNARCGQLFSCSEGCICSALHDPLSKDGATVSAVTTCCRRVTCMPCMLCQPG